MLYMSKYLYLRCDSFLCFLSRLFRAAIVCGVFKLAQAHIDTTIASKLCTQLHYCLAAKSQQNCYVRYDVTALTILFHVLQAPFRAGGRTLALTEFCII